MQEIGAEKKGVGGPGGGGGNWPGAGQTATAGKPVGQRSVQQLLAQHRPQVLQVALDLVERRLLGDPTSTDLLFEKAYLFEQLGRPMDARVLYRQVLERVPAHLGALTNLGNLLFASDGLIEANNLYWRAVKEHPEHIVSRTNLGNLLLKVGQIEAAREQFEAALQIDPAYRAAHAGLAYVMDNLGDADRAALYRSKAFSGQCMV